MKIADLMSKALTERLELDAGGEDCWIEYRATSSPEFSEAVSSFKQAASKMVLAGKELRKTVVIMGQEVEEHTEDYKKLQSIMMASLISDWSFEDELTTASAAEMLYNNPAVRIELDDAATKLTLRSNEAKKPQSNQPKENSDS